MRISGIRPIYLIWTLSSFFVAISLGVFFYHSYKDYHHRRDIILGDVSSIARIVSSSAAHSYASASNLLLKTRQRLELGRLSPGQILIEEAYQGVGVSAMGLLAPDGLMIASSSDQGVGQDFSNRDYYRAIVGGRAWNEVVIGSAVIGDVSGARIIPFALPIRDEASRLTGIVVVGYDLGSRVNAYGDRQLGATGHVSLTRLDGSIIYRNGRPDGDARRDEDLAEIARALTERSAGGDPLLSEITVVGAGGKAAFFNLVEGVPILSHVEVDLDEMMALWWAQELAHGFVMLIGLSGLGIVTFMLTLQVIRWEGLQRRVQRSAERLARQSDSIGHLLSTAHDGDGMRPDAVPELARTLGADHVSLWRVRGDGFRCVAIRDSALPEPDGLTLDAGRLSTVQHPECRVAQILPDGMLIRQNEVTHFRSNVAVAPIRSTARCGESSPSPASSIHGPRTS